MQNDQQLSIFNNVFGIACKDLPPVFQKHYDLKAFTDEQQTVEGRLTIKTHGLLKLVSPVYRLLGGLPLVTADDVPVRVSFVCSANSGAFQFNRTFNFADKKPYEFNSTMYPAGNNEFYEVMRFGVSWRFSLTFEDNRIVYHHRGYGLKIFNKFLPLPISALVGKGAGEEVLVDDDQFDMVITFTHPLLGLLYTYFGRFTFIKTS